MQIMLILVHSAMRTAASNLLFHLCLDPLLRTSFLSPKLESPKYKKLRSTLHQAPSITMRAELRTLMSIHSGLTHAESHDQMFNPTFVPEVIGSPA
jgi:hypothetical protein